MTHGPQVPGAPEPSPEDVDREWEAIVSRLGPWPDASASSGVSLGHAASPAPPQSSRGPRDYSVEEAPEDFVPPDPPAVASGRPGLVLSMIALAGAPAALLLASMIWRSIPAVAIGVLVALFIAGAGGLFLTLPRESDRRDRGPDDGAQV